MKGGMSFLASVRTQAVVLLAVAFAAGAFAGGAVERFSHRPPPGRGGPPRDRGGPGGRGGFGGPGGPGRGPPGRGGPDRGMLGFDERLDLTDQQRAKVDSIVRKRQPRVDSLTQKMWPAIQAAMDTTRAEINAVLTPAQRAHADSLRMRGPGGRGRGFGPPPDGRRGPP